MLNSLKERLDGLSPEQRRKLISSLQARQAAQTEIPRFEFEEAAPLSFAQQRLWFLDQLDGSKPTYNTPVAWRLVGRLNRQAMVGAIKKLMTRHESLRTRFVVEADSVLQLPESPTEIDFEHLEFEGLTPAQLESGEVGLIGEWLNRPFDPANGQVFRAAIVTAGPIEHYLLISMHHLVTDAWSMGVIARDLAVLYRAETTDEDAQLPDLPVRYSDYARWQRGREQSYRGGLDYWRGKLEGGNPLIELPSDRLRPKNPSHEGGCEYLQVPGELLGRLHDAVGESGTTSFMILLAVFKILLRRLTGSDDIVVGSPVANRKLPELRDMVGFFVNMLPYRTKFAGNLSFRQLLAEVKNTCVSAYAHQDIPFGMLVEELVPTRSQSHMPLVQVVFALHNTPSEAVAFEGLETQPLALARQYAKFDMAWEFVETEQGLEGLVEYSRDLFDSDSIRRMFQQYLRLVEEVAANPDRNVLSLPIISRDQEQVLHAEWNRTSVELASDVCLQDAWLARVAGQPDAIALSSCTHSVSYFGMYRHAQAIAARLAQFGVQPNELVAVVMDKSIDQVVACLGVLLAGAAYLPVENNWPLARKSQIIQSGRARIVLTTPASTVDGVELVHLNVQAIEPISREAALSALSNYLPRQQPADLAYVIFTSGSTGKPKGVMMCHRAVVNTLLDINQRFDVGSDDVVFGLSALSFDLSVYDIFGVLGAGGAIVLPDRNSLREPEQWSTLVTRHSVSIWNTVPQMMQMLTDYVIGTGGRTLDSIRLVMMSGDWIPLSLPDRIRSISAGADIYSLGGATEAAIWSIYYPIDQVDPTWKSIPYGRPLANQRFYVMNEELQACPIGVTGQLFIGGEGLAEGYWDDQERAASSFIQHPGGERLYRTGDLGRWSKDGLIEFLGRVDHQVKVNGYRIELGEIESVLASVAFVDDAVAVVRGGTDRRHIVAFVATEVASTDTLFAAVRERLPDYMIPSHIELLATLPLSSNGKVDRAALPQVVEVVSADESRLQPRDPIERCLHTVWCEVLASADIAVEDNFFAIGGDSIASVKLTVGAKQKGLELSVRDVFEFPTIVAQAATLNARCNIAAPQQSAASSARCAISTLGLADDESERVELCLPLTGLQEAMIAHSLMAANTGVYVSVVRFTINYGLDPERLRQAWQTVVMRHQALRSEFREDNEGILRQLVYKYVALPLDVLDTRHVEAGERFVEDYIGELKCKGFDHAAAPLMACALVVHSDHCSELIWAHHHALLDGWSISLVLSDLLAAYEKRRLTPAVEYSTYVDGWFAQDREALRHFWQEYLTDFERHASLPWDCAYQLGAQQVEDRYHRFAEALSRRLRGRAEQSLVSLNTMIQAAWAMIVSEGKQSNVVFGTTVSGRRLPIAGIDKVVGPLINSVPVRVSLAKSLSVTDWLVQIQMNQVELEEHASLPLAEIARCSVTGTGRALFQSLIVFQNLAVGDDLLALDQEGLVGGGSSKSDNNYPLTLAWIPGNQLELRLSFDSERIMVNQVEQLFERFEDAFSALVETEPTASLDDLRSDYGRRQLSRQREYSRAGLFHGLKPRRRAS